VSGVVETRWYGRPGLLALLAPLSWLYAVVSAIRRLVYRRGWRAVYRAPVPVIVVGNISVGGNGKTPVVIALCEALRQAGYHPGVVSRGYGGRASHYPLLVDGNSRTAEAGDEPVLIALRTGVPVCVSPRRGEAIRCLLASCPEVDLIISDDGLQHYAMARDIEIVVVDGERRLGNGWRLPVGPLREGASRLREVNFVICNGVPANAGEVAMTLEPGDIRPLCNNIEARSLPEAVDAVAAIGNPKRFFDTLEHLGLQLRSRTPFADHHQFTQGDLATLGEGGCVLMTEKDAVKCRPFAKSNWYFLPISAKFDQQFETKLIQRVKEVEHGIRS